MTPPSKHEHIWVSPASLVHADQLTFGQAAADRLCRICLEIKVTE